MDLNIPLFWTFITFGLGGLTVCLIIWLTIFAIPWIRIKLWEHFEDKVEIAVKNRFEKAVFLEKEKIK